MKNTLLLATVLSLAYVGYCTHTVRVTLSLNNHFQGTKRNADDTVETYSYYTGHSQQTTTFVDDFTGVHSCTTDLGGTNAVWADGTVTGSHTLTFGDSINVPHHSFTLTESGSPVSYSNDLFTYTSNTYVVTGGTAGYENAHGFITTNVAIDAAGNLVTMDVSGDVQVPDGSPTPSPSKCVL